MDTGGVLRGASRGIGCSGPDVLRGLPPFGPDRRIGFELGVDAQRREILPFGSQAG